MKKLKNNKIADFFIESICFLHKNNAMNSAVCINLNLEEIPEHCRDGLRREALKRRISIDELFKETLLDIAESYTKKPVQGK